ncbi:helix-turn-helix domain-containing protein [Halovivax sp.]|uniref:helix-turn-helix domain-containing protein n=1 Tax=Halovivax sp. TaxID=1935978 RepID=UPI0025C73340|nr:helix-turn-helix domain-containing protein [Halovivax sp.]
MASGIRATIRFDAPEDCPIAAFSTISTGIIDQVSTSVALPDATGSVTEFLTDADEAPDGANAEAIFSYGASNLYRTTHDGEADCPCECVGSFGCPIHRYVAEDGDLTLVFHANDFEQLQDVMTALRDRFPSVDVQRLLHPPLDETTEESVFVNRGKLTDRQYEVLQTAYERGYFERPKGANATEIAAELDIAQSTFTEHLVAAQRKILGDVLERDG